MESLEKFKKFKLTSNYLIFGGSGTSGSGCCGTNPVSNPMCPGNDTDHQTWTMTDECGGYNAVFEYSEIIDGACR